MSIEKFKCEWCGNCCLECGAELYACPPDIERWRREDRKDILRFVDIYEFDGVLAGGDLWIKQTGEELDRCPFLRKLPKQNKYKCLIHNTKPAVCKNFPLITKGNCVECNWNIAETQGLTQKQKLNFVFITKQLRFCNGHKPQKEKKVQSWAKEHCPAVKQLLRQ